MGGQCLEASSCGPSFALSGPLLPGSDSGSALVGRRTSAHAPPAVDLRQQVVRQLLPSVLVHDFVQCDPGCKDQRTDACCSRSEACYRYVFVTGGSNAITDNFCHSNTDVS